MFNEKIFIFIWFWLCLVSLFNLFDLISWIYILIINTHERYKYVKRRLNSLNSSTNISGILDDFEDKKIFKRFVNNYLREDGILALRLMSRNSHDLIVSEVIKNLYKMYATEQKQKFLINRDSRQKLSNKQRESPTDISRDVVLDERNMSNSRFAPVNESDEQSNSKISVIQTSNNKQIETPLLTAAFYQKPMPNSNINPK